MVARIHRRTVQKDFHDPDNHDGVITHLEPDILECEDLFCTVLLFPGGSEFKVSASNAGNLGSIPGSSLVAYSPRGLKELDTTE